jgi:NADH-quinone oxidoreductase subunit F
VDRDDHVLEQAGAVGLGGYDGTPLVDLDSYRAVGGYAQIAKARALTPQEVTQQIIDSNLRGRGGAFFPTGR